MKIYGLGRENGQGVCVDVRAVGISQARKKAARLLIDAQWLDPSITYCKVVWRSRLTPGSQIWVYESRKLLPTS